MRRLFQISVVLVLFFMQSANAAGTTSRDTISSNALRVCADPSNLPFSNDKLEGFENKILALIAKKLDKPLSYSWFPQTVGYVRNTLQLHKCDLISGITTSNERVQNTNPYYHSIYSLVYVAKNGPLPTDLSDEIFRSKSIGIVAGTPAANLMVKYGLLGQIAPYQLTVDTRYFSPGQKMIDDLIKEEIDAAIIWGPIAGYFANLVEQDIVVEPLVEESRKLTLDFSITMAVRYGDQQFKQHINDVLDELKPQIISILQEYNVPLVNNLGEVIVSD